MATPYFAAVLTLASLSVAHSFAPSFLAPSYAKASPAMLGSVSLARPLALSTRTLAARGPTMQAANPILSSIDKVVKENKIIVFMKGTKDFPQCGFSNTVVQILKSTGAKFETVNVLENPMLRQGIKEYTKWPTIPQVFIDGEFIGGCDILTDMYQSGELVELVEKVSAE